MAFRVTTGRVRFVAERQGLRLPGSYRARLVIASGRRPMKLVFNFGRWRRVGEWPLPEPAPREEVRPFHRVRSVAVPICALPTCDDYGLSNRGYCIRGGHCVNVPFIPKPVYKSVR